jgi:hypothetical protein
MNVKRKDDTITLQLTVDEAALLASCLQISRSPAMEELSERLIGSPDWKHVHRKREAHHGVIPVAVYNAVLERERL